MSPTAPRLAHKGAQWLVMLRGMPCQPMIKVPSDGRHIGELESAAQTFDEVLSVLL